MRVVALYRYPVKGFTPEACETLTIRHGGRVDGDRVLGARFANAAVSGDAWGTKHEFVALVNTPGLARLQVRHDQAKQRLRVSLGNRVLVDEPLDEGGRQRIAAAIADYVLGLAENPLSAHPDRLPLRIVGDGTTPRYHDAKDGFATLHSRESLAALAATANRPDLDEQRFRSNIVIEGVEAWEEQSWVGRRIRIGEVDFEAVSPKGRCLATHANPSTGERDLPVMNLLLKAFASEKPTFAVAMTTRGAGGTIRIGDKVALEEAS